MVNTAVIVGAPRSGTNMLRDALVSLDGVATWPCDEINYIWRHGNIFYPNDEIPPTRATTNVKAFIRRQFGLIAKRYNASLVVEKTCANSLRIPFVEEILIDAKYILIVRDGIDATGSADLRWKARPEFAYLLRKARFAPIRDLPIYGIKFLWAQIYRVFSGSQRLPYWGPAFDGLKEILVENPLEEVCALQWHRCVASSVAALADIDSSRVLRVRYEDFVNDPVPQFKRIARFLGLNPSASEVVSAVESVNNRSVGKGRAKLGGEKVARLEELIGDTVRQLGYE